MTARRDRLRRQRFRLCSDQHWLCFWCGVEMEWHQHRQGRHLPDNAATTDHLDHRLSPHRGSHPNELRKVAACSKCNNDRGQREARQLVGLFGLHALSGRRPLGGYGTQWRSQVEKATTQAQAVACVREEPVETPRDQRQDRKRTQQGAAISSGLMTARALTVALALVCCGCAPKEKGSGREERVVPGGQFLIQVRACQYVYIRETNLAAVLVHAGDCPNPAHRAAK